MANNYVQMTGVLLLDKVTPVIEAVFGVFELDASYPGNGEAYIAYMSESTCSWWDSVLEKLQALVDELGLFLVNDAGESLDSMQDVLMVLAEHFHALDNPQLGALLAANHFDEEADLDSLVLIAQAFDDGHGLKGYKTESSWHCDKPRLFEFGGCGVFCGPNVSVVGSSIQAVQLGEKLEAGLSNQDLDNVTEVLRSHVENILSGICDSKVRDVVRSKLLRSESVPRIVIGLDGGIIQGATADVRIEYLVYDYDIEGCDDEDIVVRPALDGGLTNVYASSVFSAEVNAGKIDEIFAAVAAEQASTEPTVS